MSETRFNLRRPNPDQAADVESYIDHGTAALPGSGALPPCRTPFAAGHAADPLAGCGRWQGRLSPSVSAGTEGASRKAMFSPKKEWNFPFHNNWLSGFCTIFPTV